jgi:hypothetical protein
MALKVTRCQVLTAVSMKMTASGILRHVVSQKLTNVSEVLTASIISAVHL